MKNFGKRLMAMAMAVAMTGAALILPPAGEVFGAVEGIRVSNGDLTESEPNNTRKTANKLVANQAMTGNVSWSNDNMDYFKYEVTENGPLRFLCENSSSTYLTFAFYNSSNSKLYDCYVESGNSCYSGYLDYKKGTTLYVSVSSGAGDNSTYTITPEQESTDPNWAIEPNNTKKKATSLKKGITKYSVINNTGDVDYFKYKSNKKGKVRLTLTLEDQSQKYKPGWSVYVYEKSGKKIVDVYEVTNDKEIVFKAKKNKTYYIKVVTYKGTLSWAYGSMYGVTVS